MVESAQFKLLKIIQKNLSIFSGTTCLHRYILEDLYDEGFLLFVYYQSHIRGLDQENEHEIRTLALQLHMSVLLQKCAIDLSYRRQSLKLSLRLAQRYIRDYPQLKPEHELRTPGWHRYLLIEASL